MFRAASMRKLRIYILARDAERVTAALGRLGALHLANSVAESGGELEPEKLDAEIERARNLLDRLQRLTARLGVSGPGDAAEATAEPAGLDELEAIIARLEAVTAPLVDQVEQTERALADVEDILKEVGPYRDMHGPLTSLTDSDFLGVRACAATAEQMAALREALPDGVLLTPLASQEWTGDEPPASALLVSGRRRRFAMETVLEQQRMPERPVPTYDAASPGDVYRQAVENKLGLQQKLSDLHAQLRAVGEANKADLQAAQAALRTQLALYGAAQSFGTTWSTVVISGWVPTQRVESVRAAVAEVADRRSVVEVSPPTAEEIETGHVPVQVVHNKLLAPFQRLVGGYGVATYTEIEPTLLFAASFMLMFGIIFGDMGHGLVLLATGLVLRRAARRESLRDIGFVVVACGVASLLFGTFLQGSFFGKPLKEMGFRLTLGLEPLRFDGGGPGNVVRYLVLALAFGICVISLGLILNVINRLRLGDIEGGVFGGFGLAGMVFYWGGLALAVRMVVAGPHGRDAWIALLVLGVPLALVALREPLSRLLEGRRPLWEQGPGVGLFEGIVEAVETSMVYVANTFSFLRVAAFALSHAALCFAVFVVQRLVDGLPGGPLWSAVVFVLGTAVIIGLEGLIVAIQILRLEYYEFFTKFFSGEGTPYEPFRLS